MVVLLASRSPAELQAQLGAWHKGQVWLAIWWMQENMPDDGGGTSTDRLGSWRKGILDFVGAAELPSLLHREALEGVLHQVRQDTV